jgi:ketosteroid isomerase-like protein
MDKCTPRIETAPLPTTAGGRATMRPVPIIVVVAALLGAGPLALPRFVLAHSPDSPGAASPAELEVLAAREAIRVAVTAKDAAALRALYTEDFTHTHGSGKVDGRDTRIVSLLVAEPTIEMAPADELRLRIHANATAIVTGRSPILNRAENRSYDFRWVQVFVRDGGRWRLAVSQATRLPRAD